MNCGEAGRTEAAKELIWNGNDVSAHVLCQARGSERTPAAARTSSPPSWTSAQTDIDLNTHHWLSFQYPRTPLKILLKFDSSTQPSPTGQNLGMHYKMHSAVIFWVLSFERAFENGSTGLEETKSPRCHIKPSDSCPTHFLLRHSLNRSFLPLDRMPFVFK